jgi:hypothetical protein
MQTFVPFADLHESAVVLDNKRLNKQLLEGRQIYSILSENRTTGGWVNHPAVKMWRNYENALFVYLENIMLECVFRGISTEKNWSAITNMHDNNWDRGSNVIMPPWWGDERVHQSHRYNLYKKDPEWYHMFVNEKPVSCCERCSYVWPTHYLTYNLEMESLVEA